MDDGRYPRKGRLVRRFADEATELEYRRFFLEQDKRQVVVAIALYTALKASFGFIDLMLGASDSTGQVLAHRYAFVLLSLFTMVLLTRVRRPWQYDGLVFAWTLAAVLGNFYTISHRPADHFGFVSTSPLLIVLFFAFFRNRFELQSTAGVMLAATDLYTVFVLRDPRPLPVLVQICASYAIAFLVGVVVTRQLKHSRRGYYMQLERERRLADAMRELAYHDELTGVLNRRSFLLQAGSGWRRPHGGQRSCVLLLDLDHFKRLNDSRGHEAGDEALRIFAALVQSTKRDQDIFGRIGGEEFALLLPQTGRAEAETVAGRIIDGCRSIRLGTHADTLSVSIGIAEVRSDDRDLAATLRRADRALYRAKDLGRGRICADEGSVRA